MGWWHSLLLVFGKQFLQDGTIGRFSRRDRVGSGTCFAKGTRLQVEAEVALTTRFIGTVALETAVREDRPNIAIEIDAG